MKTPSVFADGRHSSYMDVKDPHMINNAGFLVVQSPLRIYNTAAGGRLALEYQKNFNNHDLRLSISTRPPHDDSLTVYLVRISLRERHFPTGRCTTAVRCENILLDCNRSFLFLASLPDATALVTSASICMFHLPPLCSTTKTKE
jgi:hypothetical protein